MNLLLKVFSFLYVHINLFIKNLFNFLDLHNGSVIAVFTILLVLVTMYYAYQTQTMAKIMRKEYQLNSMPYAALDTNYVWKKFDNGLTQYEFKTTNLGRVPIKYVIEKLTFRGESIKPANSEIGSILFPSQSQKILPKSIDLKGLTKSNSAKIFIRMVYWSVDTPEVKYFFEQEAENYGGTDLLFLSDNAGRIEK